jgi:hypothetical protein
MRSSEANALAAGRGRSSMTVRNAPQFHEGDQNSSSREAVFFFLRRMMIMATQMIRRIKQTTRIVVCESKARPLPVLLSEGAGQLLIFF